MISRPYCLLPTAYCLLFAGGCSEREKSPSTQASVPSHSTAAPNSADRLLENAIAILERGSDQRGFDTVRDQLNRYVEYRSESIANLDPRIEGKISSLLGPGAVEIASRKDFTPTDTEYYLKSALFFRTIAGVLGERRTDDLAYASRLLEWVNRFVQLEPEGRQPEAPPREVCLRGSGSAHDRAWVFLELLRQGGLGGCMIGIPDPEADGEVLAWLCGVLQNREIFLYEPELGVPIPAAGGGIATLSDLAADPGLLEVLDVDPDLPYRIRPEQIKKMSILLYLEPEMLAPRMKFLESRMIGEHHVNLIIDLDLLLQKVREVNVGNETNWEVGIWRHPARVRGLMTNPSYRATLLMSMNFVWLSIEESPRLFQLRGRHEEAIKRFVRIDAFTPEKMQEMLWGILGANLPPENVLRSFVGLVQQDILYFIGLSKLEQDPPDPTVARDWFERYLSKYGSKMLYADDVLDWGTVCTWLVDHEKEGPEAPSKRIWELLSLEAREEFKKVAKNFRPNLENEKKLYMSLRDPWIWDLLPEDLQQIVNDTIDNYRPNSRLEVRIYGLLREILKQLRKEKALYGAETEQARFEDLGKALTKMKVLNTQWAEMLQESKKLQIDSQRTIVDALNVILRRRDFYRTKNFEKVVKDSKLGELFEANPIDLLEHEVLLRNRLLLEAVFPVQINQSRSRWVMGATRQLAVALYQKGRTDEAIELLGAGHPDLAPIQRAALLALARSWPEWLDP